MEQTLLYSNTMHCSFNDTSCVYFTILTCFFAPTIKEQNVNPVHLFLFEFYKAVESHANLHFAVEVDFNLNYNFKL